MKSGKIINKRVILISALSIFCLFFSISNLKSENLKKLLNLEGTWRFTIGDNPRWSEIDFDAKSWDYVYIPQSWESAGYMNYDGYAWYRKEFKLNSNLNQDPLFLVLGYIDDVDEVYLNGHLIGRTGVFPPVVVTSFSLLRKYYLPKELLNDNGNNVIAVRVYDEYQSGGIYNGPVGIFYDEDNELLVKNLAGIWDFNFKGNYANDDSGPNNNDPIYVPGHLESRGYSGLYGSVSYTKEFTVGNIDKENLVVVLGYIDGTEKVYLNGDFIGTVKDLRNSGNRDLPSKRILRNYIIPNGLLHTGVNKISVVMENNYGRGGIYEGPIGLINKNDIESLKKAHTEKPVNLLEEFIRNFFD